MLSDVSFVKILYSIKFSRNFGFGIKRDFLDCGSDIPDWRVDTKHSALKATTVIHKVAMTRVFYI